MSQRFVTEKTAKALIGLRMFIWFGGHRGLHHLRQLGFQTFDCVIDESYDDIADDHQRLIAAWEQVERLVDQDPAMVYQKVRDRLVHNQNHMLRMDSRGDMAGQIALLAKGALA